MSTLTDFLLARIAEDEADAKRLLDDLTAQIADGDYHADGRGPFTPQRLLAAEMWAQYAGQTRWRNFARGQYIARLASPMRVLAECEAKRQIVEGISRALVAEGYDATNLPDVDVFRALALPYADHPDFQEGWRP